jgi:hypothetical protein
VRQSYLAQRFTPFTANQMSQAGASMPGSQTFNYIHEMVTNQYHGMASVYALIQQQATLMAYDDIYRDLSLVAAIFISTAPGWRPRARRTLIAALSGLCAMRRPERRRVRTSTAPKRTTGRNTRSSRRSA